MNHVPDSNAQPTEPERRDGDATRFTDISYYRQSALGRLVTIEAARRARKARREAMLLIPLAVGLVLLWHYREELFGLDQPVRIAAAILLATIGWRLARDIGRAIGPRLLQRFDPGTASTVSFIVQLVALLVTIVVALRIVDLDPRAIAIGGAVTAIVIGLAAQNTIGNVIAGVVLLASRPFRVGDRVRLQAGALAGDVEGTVASIGLIYTTLARGGGTLLVPNNSVIASTVVPLRNPAGVDVEARLKEGVRPSELQEMLADLRTPIRDQPDIALQEVYSDGVIVRISVTPLIDEDGARLADEVLALITKVAAPAPD